ncbi:predicted protein [Naegleria gruberi]|uniref:Predicted protein n=1 Tax=Naegleria gruberi TaxID=5762 RepID=D2VKT7_NAEGR|nr:uncharacterized protein NAEGRDRAFT_69546 [Naegleria gruberi]EFC42426.1 predicted protein [Naegleria gruberi]|eukprot:XP_002675170.1 predicted protein [Naegleria gruberi strain NEG-M]
MFLTEWYYTLKYDNALRIKTSVVAFCLLAFLDAVTSLPIGLYGIIVGAINTPNEDEEIDNCNHGLLLNILIALGFMDLIGSVLSLIFGSIMAILTFNIFTDDKYDENSESVRYYGEFDQAHAENTEEIDDHARTTLEIFKNDDKTVAKFHNATIYVTLTRILFGTVFFFLSIVGSNMIFGMNSSCKNDNPFLYEMSATYMIVRWVVFIFSFLLFIPLSVLFCRHILSSSSSKLVKFVKNATSDCFSMMISSISNLIAKLKGNNSAHQQAVDQHYDDNL